ncbi:MAG: 7-cyano-7-deazaguanine synthase QueC [Methanosarcinales archaeon]|nr:7-cyano-7-deazaguanine synthase QueC [Methanosarcinales archaeon]
MTGAVTLLSSGLDSTVAFKQALDTFDNVICLTFDYGQRAASIEIEKAAAICKKYHCKHHIIPLPWYRNFGGALTGTEELPTPSMTELDDATKSNETARSVWVPARNMVFLSIAASFAEEHGLECIVVGFDAEEAATFPDNSPEFIELFDRVMEYGTLNHLRIFAPLADLDKEGIVRLGLEIEAPLEYSWSCYTAGPVPCGDCESCMRRKRAFSRVGVPDPLLERLGKS